MKRVLIVLLAVLLLFFGISCKAGEKKPVCTVIFAGLGNNMFQYATIFSYAKEHDREIELSGHLYQLKKFFKPEFKQVDGCSPAGRKLKIFTEKPGRDFSTAMNVPDYNVLKGYFQNEKIFKKYRKELLEVFEFKNEKSEENKKLAEKMKSENSVAIHIRRGDYLAIFRPDVLSNHYYLKAMDYIAKKVPNPHFYVFSDDVEWVKKEFKSNHHFTVVENNRRIESANDMWLMSICKHNIVANSTFSWWGAWLNKNPNKIVVSPDIWLSEKKHYETTKNIIPNDWVRIPQKAKVAVVLSPDGMAYSEFENRIKSIETFLLPWDKKTYFMKNDETQSFKKYIQSKKSELRNFDYVFVFKKLPTLGEEMGYSFVVSDKKISSFVYRTTSGVFEPTNSLRADLSVLKGKDIHLLR